MNHFAGKKPLEHLIDARNKGNAATSEIHGEELPGHFNAAADASKETAFLFVLLWIFLNQMGPLLVLLLGWLLWKTGRSAILGWRRLERLHRLIEEERWEIEHHRLQEKEELKALYSAKGFSGRLLDEVVDVLMADDNRLLQEMLEEELGLRLESYEHPLKQAAGAAVGVMGAALVLIFGIKMFPAWGPLLSAGIVIALSAGMTAKLERNQPIPAIIWNLAIASLAIASVYFVSHALLI